MRTLMLRSLAVLLFPASLFLHLAALLTPAAAGDYFLHSATTDTLDETSPTATTAKFKDSSAINRTTFQPIGTWSAAPADTAVRLQSLSGLRVWVGLKNSDDQGTYFDVRAEIRKNAAVIASGETKNIQGVTRNPDQAKEVLVSFGPVSDAVFNPGDVLSLRLLGKVADSGGHANAVGLRAYYDSVSRPSRFGATLAAGLGISITSPPAGGTVSAGTILVRGSIQATGESGVIVNGVPAFVQENAFLARVAVDPEVTELVAALAIADGGTAESRQPIVVTPAPEAPVALSPTVAMGAAPLTVGFTLTSLVPVDQVTLDLRGTGAVDFQGATLDGQSFTYSQPGLYVPIVTVTDSAAATYTATAVIHVIDPIVLDTLLQSKWSSLRGALARGDVDAAALLFTQSARDAYREQFADLAGVGALSQVAADLGPLNLVRFREGAVEYETRAVRDGAEYSFHVVFVIDRDGIWRLWAF